MHFYTGITRFYSEPRNDSDGKQIFLSSRPILQFFFSLKNQIEHKDEWFPLEITGILPTKDNYSTTLTPTAPHPQITAGGERCISVNESWYFWHVGLMKDQLNPS